MADPSLESPPAAPTKVAIADSALGEPSSLGEWTDGAGSPPRVERRRWLRAPAPPLAPRRRLFVRVLIALTSSTALLGVAALVAAAAIVPPIGARRNARAAAQREVELQIASDERIVETTFASQRRWTDMWRESFGIVVATDRRLLYVGAPPTPLLRPIDEGPDEMLVESYPYDAAFTLDPRTLFRGYGRGLVLRTPLREVNFFVDDANWKGALAVSAASARARSAVTRDIEALEAANRPSAPRATRYETYVVQRGETLTGLARRFRTTPAVLMQLNQLTTGDIDAGQRLRVPSAIVPDSTP